MKPPPDYSGPLTFACPHGYIDVTCYEDRERKAIAGPDHPYFVMRDKIASVIRKYPGLSPELLAEKILEFE